MSGIVLNTLKHKQLLCLYRKFTSSAALIASPPTEYAKNHSKLDPLTFLSNPTNLRGLTLAETKVAHAYLLKSSELYSNIYAANNLLDSYSGWSRMEHAFKLFEKIPEPNLVSWNLMIMGCNKNFLFEDSWRVFCQMHNAGVVMDEFTYGSVLSACSTLERGQQIYGFVTKNGFFSNGYVRAGMIDLFSRCCRIEDSLRVLYDIHCENVVCWNAVVSGAVKNKDHFLALEIFNQMCQHGLMIPNAFTYSSVLTACAATEDLELGKTFHGLVIKSGAEADIFVGTAILDLYAKYGSTSDAIKQFNLMPIRNVVSWTAIISGFAQKGDSSSAIWIFNEMRKTGENINNFTVSSVVAACANPAMFKDALQIHCLSFKIGLFSDPVVKASLINTYAKAGAVDLSEVAFSETQNLKELGIWPNIISAFVQTEMYGKAIIFFQRMLKEGIKPEKFSSSSILSIIDSLTFGRQVHGYILKTGLLSEVSVGSSIFTMYSKCGDLEESFKAFEQLENKDNVSWTSMISGFVEHGHADMAVSLFQVMGFEESIIDEKILAAVVNACSALRSLNLGREIHGYALRCGIFVEGTIITEALVNMYSKCGDLNSAKIVFQMMPFKSQVSWSSLISGFSQTGHIEEALTFFHHMFISDIRIDAFTISSLLGALAVSSISRIGIQLHAFITKRGLQSEAGIGSSLITIYSKSESIDDCCKIFEQIIDPDLISWTTMIASYANHGKGLEALKLFNLMKKSGIKPDAVTFVCVLSACSHTGLVEEGYFHLDSMIRYYKIEPSLRHFVCMVDLLGRAGRLEEAEKFILGMPIKADVLVWETLLAACKVHGDHEMGKVAAAKIMELEPSDAGAHIAVSNMFAEAGDWERVVEIRESMKETGVRKKEPGWSFV